MSDECKSKLEVLKVIRIAVLEGLAKMGVPEADTWQCAESSQAKILNADKIILLKQSQTSNASWVWKAEGMKDGKPVSTDNWIDLQQWLVSVVYKRKANPDAPPQSTTEDVAGLLVHWFNNRGCDVLRRHGMSNLRILSKDVKPYDDDSGVYQNRTDITLKVCVPKSLAIA